MELSKKAGGGSKEPKITFENWTETTGAFAHTGPGYRIIVICADFLNASFYFDEPILNEYGVPTNGIGIFDGLPDYPAVGSSSGARAILIMMRVERSGSPGKYDIINLINGVKIARAVEKIAFYHISGVKIISVTI